MRCIAIVTSGMCLLTAGIAAGASVPDSKGVPAQTIITALPTAGRGPATLEPGELTVLEHNGPAPVLSVQHLTGAMADMQLFVLLDDSTRSSSLSLQFSALKAFLNELPSTTQVAIGYMRNGTAALAQPFTADHQKAAGALRLPEAIPGENGSPYFVLSDLVHHWPSKQLSPRRAVLMLTDGVDRYYTASVVDDPYVDAAMHDALKQGILVYSVYLRGAGFDGRGGWVTNVAQSRLIQVSEETGGYAYFEGFSDPVTIAPFLNDLHRRFESQYLVTIGAAHEKGLQPVKFQTESRTVKVSGPAHIYVQ